MTQEKLLEIIREMIAENWSNSDLDARTEKVLSFIAENNYEGRNEDLEIFVDRINAARTEKPVLFVVQEALKYEGWNFEKAMNHYIVEIDIKNKLTFGDKLATEHIQKLARTLSQIPRVVEFLQFGEAEVWEDLRHAGWGWIPPRDYENSHLDPDGLCWYFLGDYVGVTVEA